MPLSSTHTGWRYDPENTRLDVYYRGTRAADFDDAAVNVTGTFTSAGALTVTAGGLTVTAGGLTVTAGVLSVDDATDSTSATTGSIHTDGGLGVAKNAFFLLTIENPDGVGADGEQLTSGGAAAATDWAAAASLREFKNLEVERTDAQAVLKTLVSTPVYDFRYKSKDEYGGRVMGTGDLETTYTGIVADEAPWAMHYKGKILNPINTFGYTVLGIRALNERLEKLEAALA